MNDFSSPRKILMLSSILLWVLAGIPVADASVSPSRVTRPSLRTAQTPSLDFSDVGRPRRRQGGGSRGSCLIANQPPLTALVPVDSTGYTLSQSPSFWFYQPYSLGKGQGLEFVLKDSQDNLVHSQAIADQDIAAGLIQLSLPESVVLAPDQSYEWYVLVRCDATNAERFVFVNGAIRRLERPDLQNRIGTLPSAAHANLYLTENLWYDAVDAAATQLQNAPQNSDFQQQWTQLLETVGLSELAAAPFTPCCEATTP
jgi:HPt (histidine-containing phosphotransfer) domain-containing protein